MKSTGPALARFVRRLRSPRHGGLAPHTLLVIGAIGIAVITIDYLLIKSSLEVFTNSTAPLAVVFTATSTVGMAGAAILGRLRATGHDVPGGVLFIGLFVLLWLGTVIAVTGIRVFAATVGSDSKSSNLETAPGIAPGTTEESRVDLFLRTFDPLDSEVVLAFVMILALVFTGVLTYVTTWYAHSPLAQLLTRADRLEEQSTDDVAAATTVRGETVAERDGWRLEAAQQRDATRFEAAQGSARARSRAVAERIALEVAAHLGDPEATTELMRQTKKGAAPAADPTP